MVKLYLCRMVVLVVKLYLCRMVVLVVKNPPTNAGDIRDVGLIPRSGRFPWRRKWQPTAVFLPGKSHGQSSLAGYCPWGHRESDTTERLSTHTSEQLTLVCKGAG